MAVLAVAHHTRIPQARALAASVSLVLQGLTLRAAVVAAQVPQGPRAQGHPRMSAEPVERERLTALLELPSLEQVVAAAERPTTPAAQAVAVAAAQVARKAQEQPEPQTLEAVAEAADLITATSRRPAARAVPAS